MPDRRRFRRRYVPLLLIGAIGLTGWLERRTILTRVIDDRIAAARLPVRYRIDALGPGRQRFTNLIVGDPARPDLTADWVETRTRIGVRGPYLASVAAGHVRLRGRLIDGRMSFGSLDRLLSTGSGGKGPELPALDLSVQEGQLLLATPAGGVGLALSGTGRLDRDFTGVAAILAPRLSFGNCTVRSVRARQGIAALGSDGRGGQGLRLTGPVTLGAGRCGETRLAGARADLVTRLTLGSQTGAAVEGRIATGAIDDPRGGADGVAGSIALAFGQAATRAGGDGGRVGGQVELVARRPHTAGLQARSLGIDGGIAVTDGALRYDGDVRVDGADARRWWPGLPVPAGTPAAPFAAALDRAMAAAARDLSGQADINLALADGLGITVRRARLRAASGAYAVIAAPEEGVSALEWRPGRPPVFDATATIGGGGLPAFRATLGRQAAGAPIRLSAVMTPYRVPGASLSLAPVTGVLTHRGAIRLATRVTLSGPLGDGRVEALTMPLALRRDPGGPLLIGAPPGGAACVPLAFQSVSVGGLALDPARVALCRTGPALVRIDRGGVTGGARLPATRLTGRLGGTPLQLDFADGTLALTDRRFALSGVEARLGPSERTTRLMAGQLTGALADGGVAGEFAAAGGQIANVPLVLSDGAGAWAFRNGALTLTGAARVADAAPTARFNPMAARDIALTLAGGTIAVTGALHEPTTGTRVASVRIGHRLSTGVGSADLTVPQLSFAKGFQPELLTPITFGVIADVKGAIDGAGHIAWGPGGVTSTGDFGTTGIDLAAAFGPAQGIAGRVRFDDLLGLHTPPGQVATVRSVNPGIAVENGTVRYQLLGGTRVQVEDARWPFAGGALTLDPTLLDFGAQRARFMTFHVAGARADQFLQQFDFQNLNATGTFDGVLPMVFDDSGGRIEDGRLTVRPGGGSIAYVGELGQKQLGFWGDLAFQALRSLRYRRLEVTMNGPLAGEMVTGVRFDGVSQGAGAKSNFLIRRLQRLPFVFNVRIRAPFRGLIDSAASFYDPRRLIQRNLPALLEEQNRRTGAPSTPTGPTSTSPTPPGPTPAIQPSASETMR